MHYHVEIWVPELGDSSEGEGVFESVMGEYDLGDWWQLGGRWTGAHDGYDPEKDPQNVQTCFICHGTGLRDDDLGKAARALDPTYTCNGCGSYRETLGPGKLPAWPTQFAFHPGDVMKLAEVRDELNTGFLIIDGHPTHDGYEELDEEQKVKKVLAEKGIVDGWLITGDLHL